MLATTTSFANLNDHDLTASITTATTSLTRYKAEFITAIAEFDDRTLARSLGAPSTTAWLVRTQGMSSRTAYEYLSVGRRLRPFYDLTGAFLDGDLSYSKVRLLLKYMTDENEQSLIALARAHTVPELEALLAGHSQVGGGNRKAKNRLSVTVCPDSGEVKLWGTLDPENGAELLAALKAAELANEEQAEVEGPDSSTTRFGTPTSTGLLSSFLSLVRLARNNPEAKTIAPGAQVNVIIDTHDHASLPTQPGAPAKDLLRSIINGFLSVQIRGSGGRILNLGRSSRLVTRAQEKVLLTRWKHRCAAPGCNHTRWLQFHHILDWASGGLTDLDNLIPLCSLHHAMISSGELVIVPDTVDPALLRFRFPGGESWTSVDNGPPVRDDAMGQHSDGYTHGPVPRGDEDLLDIWEHEDSFDDAVP
ncbi:HNH endonuclease signature motif containing protein [Corynebacterium sp.]|uniref:HNH endonuclease signature motif containing protein n=1 Tax=Corynebacterium sp. TaxID=1720 RepID=UPI0026DF7B35|nr:HNH endonuclease signature motif containing protein [Corynebacterium sp.]MDO5512499.1 HNH endonuclease signature motif containing protein [Corynebacterium sp.]